MPPVVSTGPETRSRIERRRTRHRIADVERTSDERGPAGGERPAAAASAGKRTVASRDTKRKRTAPK